MAESSRSASAGKVFSSTIGPAGEARTWANVWSLADLSVKATVLSSGAATDSTFPSSDDGPLASAILIWRSKLYLTVEALTGLPFANFRPSRSVQVYTVSEVNSQLLAASGASSAPPGLKLMRNG
jgi:hypothetical protein